MYWLLLALPASVFGATPAVDPARNPMVVHEWGTFTSVAGTNGYAAAWSPLSGPDDLPCFVKGTRFPLFKLNLRGRIRMETPVVYFYSDRPAEVSVSVKFPHGLITEWYPDAQVPPVSGQPELESADGRIVWPHVRVLARSAPATFPVEPGASHYYAARNTDANPVAIEGEGEGGTVQQDRFLFYRGAGGFESPVAVTVADASVNIRPTSDAAIPALILFENRGGRIGYRVHGALRGPVTLPRPPLDASLDDVLASLKGSLLSAGLFGKEAQAMIDTWRDSWFEEGSRILYLVPPAIVESELPMKIDPTPAKTVRAFVGRAEFFTPDSARLIEGAVKARDAASLQRFGRFAAPQLLRLLPSLSQPDQQFAFETIRQFFPAANRCAAVR